MFSLPVDLRPLVAILALSLCAGADSIPAYASSGLKPPAQFQRGYSATLSTIQPLYNSAISQRKPAPPAQARVFFAYEDGRDSNRSVRAANLLEWLFSIVTKIVLPGQGKHRAKR